MIECPFATGFAPKHIPQFWESYKKREKGEEKKKKTIIYPGRGKKNILYQSKMAEHIKFKFQTYTHCSQQKALPTPTAYSGNTQSSKMLEQACKDSSSWELARKKSRDIW